MKEYLHNGEPLPAELLDRIADDVRLFDKQLTPEMRTAKALEKIADRILRVKIDVYELERKAERITLAHEIAAAAAVGVEPASLYQLPALRQMFPRLGVPLPPRSEGPADA